MRGAAVPHLDPGALTRVLVRAQSGDIEIDETNVAYDLGLELDRAALPLPDGAAQATLSAGVVHVGSLAISRAWRLGDSERRIRSARAEPRARCRICRDARRQILEWPAARNRGFADRRVCRADAAHRRSALAVGDSQPRRSGATPIASLRLKPTSASGPGSTAASRRSGTCASARRNSLLMKPIRRGRRRRTTAGVRPTKRRRRRRTASAPPTRRRRRTRRQPNPPSAGDAAASAPVGATSRRVRRRRRRGQRSIPAIRLATGFY